MCGESDSLLLSLPGNAKRYQRKLKIGLMKTCFQQTESAAPFRSGA